MSIYQIPINNARGKALDWEAYKGKVLLIVNTASKCGFTPQYDKLQKIYEDYKDKGFVVIGCPSNDFAGQEPLDSDKAEDFCKINYGVTFPITEKIHVKNNSEQHPLFTYLGNEAPGANLLTHPKWNFQKYLVDRNGKVVDYFISTTEPDSDKVRKRIESLL